jgi:ribosomal protein S18 acetylase RimI-like enzyme
VRRIAVAPRAQRQGVGRALTQALIASARAASVEVLTLDVRADNAAALHLYQSLGFTEYGRLKDFVAVGSRRYDTVMYALDLREQPAS